MTEESMPTIKELQTRVGVEHDSIRYQEKRSVLHAKYKGTPVSAYGIGLGGFIAVYQDGHGFPQAMGYSVKGLFSKGWGVDGGFHEVGSVQNALDIIKSNELMVDKKVNEKELKIIRQRQQFVRPIVANIHIKTTPEKPTQYNEGSVDKYEVTRFKNGKYKIINQGTHWASNVSMGDFVKIYLIAKENGLEEQWSSKHRLSIQKEEILEKDLMNKMEKLVILQEI